MGLATRSQLPSYFITCIRFPLKKYIYISVSYGLYTRLLNRLHVTPSVRCYFLEWIYADAIVELFHMDYESRRTRWRNHTSMVVLCILNVTCVRSMGVNEKKKKKKTKKKSEKHHSRPLRSLIDQRTHNWFHHQEQIDQVHPRYVHIHT